MNESFKDLTTLKLRSLKTGVTGQRGGENVNRLRGISCLECVQSISRVSIWITNDSMQICTIFQLVSHTFTIAFGTGNSLGDTTKRATSNPHKAYSPYYPIHEG